MLISDLQELSRKPKSVWQRGEPWCAAAAIKTILNYYGMPAPSLKGIAEILSQKSGKVGAYNQDVANYFGSLGLKTRYFNKGNTDILHRYIMELDSPVYVSVVRRSTGTGHALTAWHIDKQTGRVSVLDPNKFLFYSGFTQVHVSQIHEMITTVNPRPHKKPAPAVDGSLLVATATVVTTAVAAAAMLL